jgi:hypothetical protein
VSVKAFAFHDLKAQRDEPSTDWFYVFKLHIIVDDRGEILAFSLIKGNADDRKPAPHLAKKVIGKLFTDRPFGNR